MIQGNGQEFKNLQRHGKYYLNGGDLHLMAGNELFRVHRYFFERESRVFRELMEVPASSGNGGGPQQGDTDSTAIVLSVSADNFSKLLGVFYNPKYSLFDWTIEDWKCILTLAHEWEFDEVKNLAIRELQRLDIGVIDRIVLYQNFKVDRELIIPLYATLCSQDEALTEEEAESLGIKTTVLIYRARERLRARPSDGGRSPLPPGLEKEDIHRTITTLLGTASQVSSPVDGQSGSSATDAQAGGRGSGGDNTQQNTDRNITKNVNGRTGRAVGKGKA